MSKLLQKFIAAKDPGKSFGKPELQKLAKELDVEFEKDNNKTTLATLIQADLKAKAGSEGAEGAEDTSSDAPAEAAADEAGEEKEEAPAKPVTDMEVAIAETERLATRTQGLVSAHILSQKLTDAGIKNVVTPSANPRQVSVTITVGKKSVTLPEEGLYSVDL